MNRLRHTYCGQSFSLRYDSFQKVLPSRAAGGYLSNKVNERHGAKRLTARKSVGHLMERVI